MELREKVQILTINQLLDDLNLRIPVYQRPYKWKIKNIMELIYDIEESIKKSALTPKYRIGTIILFKDENKDKDYYEIIDGQQRIISILLIKKCLNDEIKLNLNIKSDISKKNILDNYKFIEDYFKNKEDDKKQDFKNALDNILECVVFVVNKLPEAFQLFDSQNTRGKELNVHDLLKAYHLREIRAEEQTIKKCVTKWEEHDSNDIKELFEDLFNIYNWAYNRKSHNFSLNDIDIYKGVGDDWDYKYSNILKKEMPEFQIYNSFIAGENFFYMVEYYMKLKGEHSNIANNSKKRNC